MNVRILKARRGLAGHRCRSAVILVALSVTLLSCGRQDDGTYASARRYFYGAQGQTGYLVSSWEGASRSKRLTLRRAAYGLNDGWDYVDEDLEVKNLGDYEYFFRYSIHFRNPATKATFIRNESYYSIGDELWEPVPLTSNTYTLDENGRAIGSSVTESLWQCDFDGFLADRDVDCVKRVGSSK